MSATLFHDGCNICLAIADAFAAVPGSKVDIVNLGLDKGRAQEAKALGVTRLPALVVDGAVYPVSPHSPIEHVL